MEDIALENHIVKQFDEELDEIRTLLMAMGGMVEQQLQDSIQSIVKVDSGLADSVIERDKRVDEMELEIDEACLKKLTDQLSKTMEKDGEGGANVMM